MLKWLGLRRNRPQVRIVQRTEDEWRCADQLSLFLLVRHHTHGNPDWHNSLSVSTYNSLIRAGFADGWTEPLSGGPRRHPELDIHTRSEFITLKRNRLLRHVAQVAAKETYAWDGLYRSEIGATATSFCLSLPDEAMNKLVEKVRVGEYLSAGSSTSCWFAVRLPVRRRFEFPEPRASEKPYSEGRDPKPFHDIARVSADWIEVAALNGERIRNEEVGELPLGELFADAGPVRISLSG